MAVVDSGRRTSKGAVIWKAAPSKPTSTGGSGGSSTKKTYTYKLGDKPPKSSDYSSYRDYSRASYAYSKNKRAVTIARVKAGLDVSSSDLRGAGIQSSSGGGYRYYDSATKKYITTPPTVAILQQKAAEKEIAEKKATTSAREKQIMILELGIQQGLFSKAAEAKARAHQQELMKDMPEKEPVETAFVIGGKTFVGTFGIKKVYAKAKPEEKAPAIYTGIPAVKKDDKPTIPTRQKEWEETVDVTTPSSILYTDTKGILTKYKAPTGKWAGTMYDIRKELETKEIEATRKGSMTDMWKADVYGFGSAALYPFRTPESTGQLFTTFGKGVAVGVGVTVLSMTTGPVVPAVLIYGGSIYGATQIPRLQEQIAESKFLGPVAYREKLSGTGAHVAAAIGGAVVGSKLVPASITTYKGLHDKYITSKGATVEKGDYLWKEGYYSKTALKDWEKTIVKSKFISEAQKQAVLQGKGDPVWNKGFLEKGSGKVLTTKQQDFLRQDFYHRLYVQDQILRLRIDKLALPSQARQTQLGFDRFNIESVARADLQLSSAAKIQAAMKSHQYLGKWITRPSLTPKADVGVSYPKLSYSEQYTLIDATGGRFFESSYFRTGYYKPVPKLLLDYKPVGKAELFSQWVSNVEYPPPPRVFTGKKGSIVLEQAYGDTVYKESGDALSEGMFGKMFKKGTSPLSDKRFGSIEKVATGQKDYTVYDWEFYPASMTGIIAAGKVDKTFSGITPINLLFQKQTDLQKHSQIQLLSQVQLQEQEQMLEQKQILFQFQIQEQKQLQQLKQEQEQVLSQRQKQRTKTSSVLDLALVQDLALKQEQKTIPILEFGVPTITINDKKIKIDEEPPPPTPFPFGFGRLPSMSKTTKLRGIPKPRARPRPKRREVTIDPFAGLYSVHVSEFAFGKATHPARTKEEKEKFKKRILGGAQIFPTVEMEKFRLGKLKL